MILKYRFLISSSLIAVLIFIDQFSKYTIRAKATSVKLDYICNTGIAFGFHPNTFLFWTAWSVAVFFLFFILYKKASIYESFFVVLILAGTLSNIFDRVKFGCITDFIDLHFWPVFNLADIYITIGSILLLFSLIKKDSGK